jgi:hypothetical protein
MFFDRFGLSMSKIIFKNKKYYFNVFLNKKTLLKTIIIILSNTVSYRNSTWTWILSTIVEWLNKNRGPREDELKKHG